MKKLLEDKRFMDVEFKVGNLSIHAHKCVVALHSWYFSNIFSGTNFFNPYTVENANETIFLKIIGWMYTNEITIFREEYQEFCHIINFYGMDTLKPTAVNLFREFVNDLQTIMILAVYDYLRECCTNVCYNYRHQFRDQPSFYTLLFQHPEINEQFIKRLIDPIPQDYIEMVKQKLVEKAESSVPHEAHLIYDDIDNLTKRPSKDKCVKILEHWKIDSIFLNNI